jgi:ferredoxin
MDFEEYQSGHQEYVPQSDALAHAERPAQAAKRSIHLVVDLNRCQAYAQCCFLAPDVFRLHGEEALWYDPSPDPGRWEHVVRAAAACPVQAISVEGEEVIGRRHRKHPGRREHREQRKEPHAAQRV